MIKQYFSKYLLKWVDLKPTDGNGSGLKKYKYKFRFKKHGQSDEDTVLKSYYLNLQSEIN